MTLLCENNLRIRAFCGILAVYMLEGKKLIIMLRYCTYLHIKTHCYYRNDLVIITLITIIYWTRFPSWPRKIKTMKGENIHPIQKCNLGGAVVVTDDVYRDSRGRYAYHVPHSFTKIEFRNCFTFCWRMRGAGDHIWKRKCEISVGGGGAEEHKNSSGVTRKLRGTPNLTTSLRM